jgi:hypothetical protein
MMGNIGGLNFDSDLARLYADVHENCWRVSCVNQLLTHGIVGPPCVCRAGNVYLLQRCGRDGETTAERTVHQEIVRVKVQRVKQHLISTELTLADIAVRTGFEHPEYMSVAFKHETRSTPGGYRTEYSKRARRLEFSASPLLGDSFSHVRIVK